MRKFRLTLWALIVLAAFQSATAGADPLDSVAKKISKASGKIKNKQIAVLPFPYHDGREGPGSTIISERLITKIASHKKLQVVERSLLEKVLGELKLQYSGAINQESAKKLGSILGVESILTGTLIDLGGDRVEVNARLIQTESGLVIAAASEVETRTWQDDAQVKAWATRPAAGEGGQDPEKMSVFFHSREWKDPRFQDAPEDEKPSPQQNAEPRNSMVLSNKGEREAISPIEDDFMTESPSDFLGPNREGRESAEFKELQGAWDSIRGKDYAQAADRFSRLKDHFLDDREYRLAALAQVYLGEVYFRQGRPEEAIRECRPVARLEKFPRIRASALYVIARSLEVQGKPHMAENIYREIVQNYPFESRLIRASGWRLREYAGRAFSEVMPPRSR